MGTRELLQLTLIDGMDKNIGIKDSIIIEDLELNIIDLGKEDGKTF
jgi:hypothetical protein